MHCEQKGQLKGAKNNCGGIFSQLLQTCFALEYDIQAANCVFSWQNHLLPLRQKMAREQFWL